LPVRLSSLRLILISSLLLLALLMKKTAILFFISIALYRILFRYRQKLAISISLSIPAVLYAIIRFGLAGASISNHTGNPLYASGQPFGIRLLNLPAIWFYYRKNFIYPSHFQYQPIWIIRQTDYPHFYFPLLFDITFIAILIIIGLLIDAKRRANRPVFIFFFAWLIVGLLFHSQIFPLDVTLANRWMYLPIIGFLGTIGVGIQSVKVRSLNTKVIGFILAAAVIIIFLSLTIITNTYWQSEQTLIIHRVITTDDITAQEKLFDQNTVTPTPDIWTPPIQ
jgi:hypothetical protein